MKKVVLIISMVFFYQSVALANFSCNGQVETLAIGPQSGMLQVNAGHGMHYLCSFETETNGVHPETCKAWYSMFLAAQAAKREVSQSYSNSAGTNCSTLGNWAVPNPVPYFVSLAE